MRRLTALLLASTLSFAAVAQDAASTATRTAQAEIAGRLPLSDPRDEANVMRGKLAEIPGGVIQTADGKIVWDRRPYAFLSKAEAPDTVNPSLWRQARLDAVHGLFEVVPGKIWQARGYDISVMTIIRGKSGWIIVDPLLSEEAAAASWKLFADTIEAKAGKLPIKAVIFSHSHSDHFGGVGGIVTPEQVKAQKIRIIAPHGFSEEATSENVLAGGAMGRRALYMFGAILPPGVTGQVDTGLGPKLSSGTVGYMEPTEIVSEKGGTLMIDGLAFDFLDAGSTEAEYNAWPERERTGRMPIERGPFVAIGPVRYLINFTDGGVAVSDELQVLGKDRQPVPGLYAAGFSGMGGVLLEGHGHHLGWAFTSGRLAGRRAAHNVVTADIPEAAGAQPASH